MILKIRLVPLSLFLFLTCVFQETRCASPRNLKWNILYILWNTAGASYIPVTPLNSHSITGPALLGRVESSGVLEHRAKVGHHEAERTVSPM